MKLESLLCAIILIMKPEVVFETLRELVCVTNTDNIPPSKDTHVFAICVTEDNEPLIAVRRSSFAFQKVMTQRYAPYCTLRVPKLLLKYMYTNEIMEINQRLKSGCITDLNTSFEELILLGGKVNKSESVFDCLKREIEEESDSCLTIKKFNDKVLKITTFDKLLNKTFIGYCTLCFVEETLDQVMKANIYNVEVRKIKSLNDSIKNDKYQYLNFIYKTLINDGARTI